MDIPEFRKAFLFVLIFFLSSECALHSDLRLLFCQERRQGELSKYQGDTPGGRARPGHQQIYARLPSRVGRLWRSLYAEFEAGVFS